MLKDGRRLLLDGSNDVNSSNRGIYVEDERFGRVRVKWDAFDSVASDRLPAAVEIAVWYDAWPGEDAEDFDAEADDEDDFDTEPRRLTFDRDAGFDERAFAETSDLDLFDEPRPDRLRVIAVPGATPPAPAPDDAVLEPAP